MNNERKQILVKLKTVYREVIVGAKAHGYSVRSQAEDLGVQTVTVSNASNPNNLQHLPAIDLLIAHAKNIHGFYKERPELKPPCSPFAVLDEMEFLSGRVAFSLPEIAGDPNGISTILAENVQEFGDVLQEIGKVMADGKIYRSEYAGLETEIMQQVRKSMALLKAAKDMVIEDVEE
jgi:hypothetical protein